MTRFIRLVAAFLLLAAPTLANASQPSFASPPAFAQDPAVLEQLKTAELAKEKARSAHLADAENEELKTAFEKAEADYETVLDKARSERDANGGNSSEYGLALVEISGEAEDSSGAALANLASKWTAKAKAWLVNDSPGYLIRVVMFLVILAVFKVLASLGAGLTRKTLSTSRLKVSDLLKKFFVGIVSKLIFLVGLIIALDQLGIDTGPLLAGIGVVGFVVGFAMQDTLSNFASGIMILLYRPFDIGDFITAGGETGKIEEMSLVSTTMLTPDNQKLIVPNSAIWGGTIRNVTAKATRRVDLTVGISYSDDLDLAQSVLLELISGHEKVLKDPVPVVRVSKLGESSVDLIVRPWCKTSDYWELNWELTKSIKQLLDEKGISIPFPQRDLHLVDVPEKMSISG